MIEIKKKLRDPNCSLLGLLHEARLDKLDETVALLRRHRSAGEVCEALVAFIATAPLDQFERLRDVYDRYCCGVGTKQA